MYTASAAGRGRLGSNEAIFHRTVHFRSSTPQWTRLNGTAVYFEYNIDEEGNNQWKLWEWQEKA